MFVIGAARARGFKIVKFQHGGHYGYYRDFTHMLEVEFPDTDIFLSWGWTRLPEHPEFSSLQVLPMPGPWMSERRLYWSKYRVGLGRRFDMLWMLDRVCSRHKRADNSIGYSKLQLPWDLGRDS
jgi:hypothetical protein